MTRCLKRLGAAELIEDELRCDGEVGGGVLDVGGSDMSVYVRVLEGVGGGIIPGEKGP